MIPNAPTSNRPARRWAPGAALLLLLAGPLAAQAGPVEELKAYNDAMTALIELVATIEHPDEAKAALADIEKAVAAANEAAAATPQEGPPAGSAEEAAWQVEVQRMQSVGQLFGAELDRILSDPHLDEVLDETLSAVGKE